MPIVTRSRRSHRRQRVVLVSLALTLTGCDLPTGPLDFAGGALTGIDISGDSVVAVGDSIRLSAYGNVSGIVGMFSYDPLSDAHWSTSNAAVATVTPVVPSANDSTPTARVVVRGVRQGTATITVSARGISGWWPVRVIAPAPAGS